MTQGVLFTSVDHQICENMANTRRQTDSVGSQDLLLLSEAMFTSSPVIETVSNRLMPIGDSK